MWNTRCPKALLTFNNNFRSLPEPAWCRFFSPSLLPELLITVRQGASELTSLLGKDNHLNCPSLLAARSFDQPYEVHDQLTLTSLHSRQRQQPLPAHVNPHLSELSTRSPLLSSSSTSSSRPHLLRRTPRLENILFASRPTATVRFAPQITTVEADPEFSRDTSQRHFPAAQQEEYQEPYQSSLQQTGESFWPRRTNRVSSQTVSAILWALEEAIRTPFLFTPDLSELNASMSDLVGGGIPSGQTGYDRPQNGTSRTAPGPVAAQPTATSGVRTPTDIMRQRRDREARKKAEEEARERDKQESEWRLKQEQKVQQQQIQQFPQPGRHQPAAGVAGETSGDHRRPVKGVIPQDHGSRRDRADSGGMSRIPTHVAPARGTTGMQSAVPPAAATRQQNLPTESCVTGDGTQQVQTSRQRGTSVSQQRPAPASAQPSSRIATGTWTQPVTSSMHSRPQTMPTQAAPPLEEPGISYSQQSQPPQPSQQTQSQSQQQQSRPRAPFPHAFERWETLSSHWEGLTSYWIRRLEQNNEDLSRDPLNQQMSRQITDLSAAGANLFHAVVELQRLRASSERKFQRWFFDTRAEQEHSREVQAELERLLRTERQSHADAASSIAKTEGDKAKAEELVREMRRELQISKEEARRAWEELGRREQEERDRTISLRSGEPTIVGGVQVVPMMQSALSRHTSTNRPPTREGPYPGGPGPTSMGGQSRQDVPESTEQYVYDSQVSSPTGTDILVERSGEAGHQIYHISAVSQPPISAAAMVTARTATSQAQTSTTASSHSQQPHAEDPKGRFYHHDPSALPMDEPKTTGTDERSYLPPDEPAGSDFVSEEYELRNPQYQERRIEYSRTISDDSGDYDNMGSLSETGYGPGYDGMAVVEYGSGPPGSSPESIHEGGFGQNVDRSVPSWGGQGSTWDSMTPTHRHPTRLSAVLEEDERSRTSPSRASQASRGMH
ncbi:hypothetical protein ACO22_05050 [Paracoccidioides brasiliensis]|uniref:Uncharacterized protein n=1 Tax=Paracoccidioides brasiliensis TaxID=121759 RepID=A0A1D2JBP5_PARBR|nr:hypothetical protein ACO22_05050 [Paracoccidioides brasiliensis]